MKYLAFEGLDGSGKSTQLAAVAAALRERGEEVICVREPGALGADFRQMLLKNQLAPSAQMFAFLADRAQNFAQLEGIWQRPGWLLSDRSYVSHIAYAQGFCARKLLELNLLATGGRALDFVVYLDASVQLASERICGRGEEISPLESAKNLAALRFDEALNLAQSAGSQIIRIAAQQPREQITEQILRAIC